MSKILVDVGYFFTRVARLDFGVLNEFYLEHKLEPRIVGNIYKGVVTNVLQDMQAAFVNIGQKKNAFLFVSDIPVDRRDISGEIKMPEVLSLKVGEEVMCQVIKDEVSTKGARISTNVSIAGRLVVSTPTLNFVGVSRKIEDLQQKQRLVSLISKHADAKGFGGIARTLSAETTDKEITTEIKLHKKLWKEIQKKYKSAKVGEIIYRECDLIERTVRDMVTDDVEKVFVNDAQTASDIKALMSASGQKNLSRVVLAEGDLFSFEKVEQQVSELLQNKVRLFSGGELVIDKTEALTIIDVNSSGHVCGDGHEGTVTAVNLEAAVEIARQLRLRNISGIIVVDFIDMQNQENRDRVLEILNENLKKDRIKCRVAGMTSLGLVEITRKKIRKDVESMLLDNCTYCGGSGKVMSWKNTEENIAREISAQLQVKTPEFIVVDVPSESINAFFGGLLSQNLSTTWQDLRIYLVPSKIDGRKKYRINYCFHNAITLPDTAKLLY